MHRQQPSHPSKDRCRRTAGISHSDGELEQRRPLRPGNLTYAEALQQSKPTVSRTGKSKDKQQKEGLQTRHPNKRHDSDCDSGRKLQEDETSRQYEVLQGKGQADDHNHTGEQVDRNQVTILADVHETLNVNIGTNNDGTDSDDSEDERETDGDDDTACQSDQNEKESHERKENEADVMTRNDLTTTEGDTWDRTQPSEEAVHLKQIPGIHSGAGGIEDDHDKIKTTQLTNTVSETATGIRRSRRTASQTRPDKAVTRKDTRTRKTNQGNITDFLRATPDTSQKEDITTDNTSSPDADIVQLTQE